MLGRHSVVLLILLLGLSHVGVSNAQDLAVSPNIDASKRQQVIDTTLKQIEQNYVFPEIATRILASIRGRLQRKEYDQISDPAVLAEKLTLDLREVSRDKHMSVRYYIKPLPP